MKFTSALAIPMPVLRLVFLAVSFYVAYGGQRVLESREDETLGWMLLLVAAVPLYFGCIGLKASGTAMAGGPLWLRLRLEVDGDSYDRAILRAHDHIARCDDRYTACWP